MLGAVLGAVLAVPGVAVALGAPAARAAAPAPAGAPLGVAVAAYAGDSVTTPTEAALAGTDLTYEVTVSNTGSSAQSNVAVPVDLPTAFSLADASVTPSSGTTSLSGTVLTWAIPSLGAGDLATLTYTETTDAPAAMETDTASVSATSDQTTTASTASAAVEVIPASNLTISVSDGLDSVAPGSSDIYQITVTNNGPSAATDATVTDTMSAGFTATAAVSSVTGPTYTDLGDGQFQWTGIDLAAGATDTFDLVGTVASTLTAGSAFVSVATIELPPGEVDTNASANAVDSDLVAALPQAITFSPPASRITGQSATLTATGGASGNPVVFSVDSSSGTGVCDVTGSNGSTLDYDAPGTCVIDANQAGNASYAAAPTVTASIAVEQAPAFTADAPATSATAGVGYTYTFAASGVPVPAFALAGGAPSWLSVDAATGALSGTPPSGTTSFAYSVVASNSAGTATAGPFTVSVTSPPPPPPPPSTSPDADIAVSLQCPSTLQVRTIGSCTLTVANNGPATATFVAAELALPRSFARVSAPARAMWFGNDVMWFSGSLAAGSSEAYVVSFRPLVTGRGVMAGAALSDSPDPNWANNLATTTVTVTS